MLGAVSDFRPHWQKQRGQCGPGQLARLGRRLAVRQLLVTSWALPREGTHAILEGQELT